MLASDDKDHPEKLKHITTQNQECGQFAIENRKMRSGVVQPPGTQPVRSSFFKKIKTI
ncbi:MAG: hypothetical protein RI973_835 [Bacteroidota bacterium]|jgi:hypothetical protein